MEVNEAIVARHKFFSGKPLKKKQQQQFGELSREETQNITDNAITYPSSFQDLQNFK